MREEPLHFGVPAAPALLCWPGSLTCTWGCLEPASPRDWGSSLTRGGGTQEGGATERALGQMMSGVGLVPCGVPAFLSPRRAQPHLWPWPSPRATLDPSPASCVLVGGRSSAFLGLGGQGHSHLAAKAKPSGRASGTLELDPEEAHLIPSQCGLPGRLAGISH